MDKNINLEILNSFFAYKDFWLDDLEFMEGNYQTLARKLLKVFVEKETIPSKALVLKNLDKMNFDKNPDEDNKVRKHIKGMLHTLMDMEDDPKQLSFTQEEMVELLKEEYLSSKMYDYVPELSQAVQEKEFNKVKECINKIDNVLEMGSDTSLNEDDDKDSFENEEDDIIFKETGLWKNTNMEKVPEGSLILVSSRSKTGKTSLLIKSLTENFLNGKDCVVYSYEIPKQSLRNRMLSYVSNVPLGEINEKNFSQGNADRVKLARYVISRDISVQDAMALVLEKGWEALKELPKRKNRLILRASNTKQDIEELRKQNKRPKFLPTDREILQEVRRYNKVKALDFVYIDYVSLIPFEDTKASREGNISTFTRNLKQTLLETSVCCMLLSQSKSKAEPHVSLYSQSMILDCDMALSITPTRQLSEEGLTAISLTWARHTEGFTSYIAEPHLEVQDFTLTGDTIDFDDILDQIKKENKPSNKD